MGDGVTLLRALGDLTMSWRGTVQLPLCSERLLGGQTPFAAKALFK